jgi:hypothetical protein
VEGLRNPVEPAPALRPGEPNPGVSRGTPPQANPAGGKPGKQAVQGAKHWDPVDTSGGLRHEISPGAVNDAESGYNKYAEIQELHGTHDGKPVPGRNKLPELDGTDESVEYALHHAPGEMEKFGGEMTDAVDGTFDDLIHGAGKKSKEKKIFQALKPEVEAVDSGWSKVLGAINKGWDAIWDTIFWPFRELWKWIKTLVAKIAKWFGVVAKGAGVFSKIAAGFQKVFTAIKATRAWKAIKFGAKFYWTWATKVRPMIMKYGAKWLGRAVSAVGWCTLLWDIMDLAQLTECLTRVNKEGNGPELPKYCQGEATKMIMGWMGHKMNTAAGHKNE